MDAVKIRAIGGGGGETVDGAGCRREDVVNCTGGGGRDSPGGVVVLAGCVGAVAGAEMVAGSDNPVMLYVRVCACVFTGRRAEVDYGWTAPPTDGRSSPTDGGRRRHRRR